jgi:hypothetical protein
MSFDETLRQALDTLTDRLRDEIAGTLNGVADELTKAAQTDRDRAADDAAGAARADADREAAARLSDAVADADRAAATHLSDAVAAAEAAARKNGRAAGLAASERLLHAIRDIDRAASLSEILDTLLSAAGREATRVGILLVRGTTLVAWRFVDAAGSGSAFEAANAAPLTLEIAAASDAASGTLGVLGDAVRTGAAASSDTSGGLSQPPFELPDGRERVALPIPMSGQVVAVLYADQGADDDAGRDVAIAWPSILEVLTRHAARSLEALTAFKAARVLTGRPDVPSAEAPGTSAHGSAGDPPHDDRGDGDEAAQRYARLLVSEIKLYHEPAIVAGRFERDLTVRLGGEIARARSQYEQRVPAEIRARTGYFDAELVRTLADGDATLLGQTT